MGKLKLNLNCKKTRFFIINKHNYATVFLQSCSLDNIQQVFYKSFYYDQENRNESIHDILYSQLVPLVNELSLCLRQPSIFHNDTRPIYSSFYETVIVALCLN